MFWRIPRWIESIEEVEKVRLRKVIAWRIISFVVAGCTAVAFLGRDLAVESWTLTAWLNVQMTFVHYAFEWAWEEV